MKYIKTFEYNEDIIKRQENLNNHLILAINSKRLNKVKELIDKGAEVNHIIEKTRRTPLMMSSISGTDKISEYLIEKGANIDAVDYMKRTALMLAAMNTKYDIVDLLIENCADMNMVDDDDYDFFSFLVLK